MNNNKRALNDDDGHAATQRPLYPQYTNRKKGEIQQNSAKGDVTAAFARKSVSTKQQYRRTNDKATGEENIMSSKRRNVRADRSSPEMDRESTVQGLSLTSDNVVFRRTSGGTVLFDPKTNAFMHETMSQLLDDYKSCRHNEMEVHNLSLQLVQLALASGKVFFEETEEDDGGMSREELTDPERIVGTVANSFEVLLLPPESKEDSGTKSNNDSSPAQSSPTESSPTDKLNSGMPSDDRTAADLARSSSRQSDLNGQSNESSSGIDSDLSRPNTAQDGVTTDVAAKSSSRQSNLNGQSNESSSSSSSSGIDSDDLSRPNAAQDDLRKRSRETSPSGGKPTTTLKRPRPRSIATGSNGEAPMDEIGDISSFHGTNEKSGESGTSSSDAKSETSNAAKWMRSDAELAKSKQQSQPDAMSATRTYSRQSVPQQKPPLEDVAMTGTEARQKKIELSQSEGKPASYGGQSRLSRSDDVDMTRTQPDAERNGRTSRKTEINGDGRSSQYPSTEGERDQDPKQNDARYSGKRIGTLARAQAVRGDMQGEPTVTGKRRPPDASAPTRRQKTPLGGNDKKKKAAVPIMLYQGPHEEQQRDAAHTPSLEQNHSMRRGDPHFAAGVQREERQWFSLREHEETQAAAHRTQQRPDSWTQRQSEAKGAKVVPTYNEEFWNDLKQAIKETETSLPAVVRLGDEHIVRSMQLELTRLYRIRQRAQLRTMQYTRRTRPNPRSRRPHRVQGIHDARQTTDRHMQAAGRDRQHHGLACDDDPGATTTLSRPNEMQQHPAQLMHRQWHLKDRAPNGDQQQQEQRGQDASLESVATGTPQAKAGPKPKQPQIARKIANGNEIDDDEPPGTMGTPGKAEDVYPTVSHVLSDYEPQQNDVVCGSGYNDHPGNVVVKSFLKESMERYARLTTDFTREMFLDEILKAIASTGGAFIRWSNYDMEWIQLSQSQSRYNLAKKIVRLSAMQSGSMRGSKGRDSTR